MKMDKIGTILTQEYLKSILDYDSVTGIFTWKIRKANWINVGDKAGRPDKDGYLRICIDGNEYKSHRIAYFYIYGECPEYIDHINLVKDDNRILNLRSATIAENIHNRTKTSRSTSGYKGVNYHKYSKKWRATISRDKKQYCLGYFDTPEEASFAYSEAAIKIYGNHARTT
jgi:HNH endonuclease/AP2 domain